MRNFQNLSSASTQRAASLTDVYVRSLNNADSGALQGDPAPIRQPLKAVELDYPHISTQPEYAIEADKLNRFTTQRDAALTKLQDLRAQAGVATKAEDRTEESVISKAESLLAGDAQKNLNSEIEQTGKLITALEDAVKVQHGVLLRVTRELSRAAGRRYAEEHKDRVKRLMAAVTELHAANQAERDLHHDLARLGYTEGALPAMVLHSVEDPADRNGNIAHYWFNEAKKYVQSASELAAGVRKSRLAAALG